MMESVMQWMAPEVLHNVFERKKTPYGHACDIYSYGGKSNHCHYSRAELCH